MDPIGRAVYKAIIDGKWLDIIYVNQKKETTRYWIGIKDISPRIKMLTVDGFNMAKAPEPTELKIYFDSIQSAKVIDGTYYPRNEKLIADIKENFENYSFLTFSPVNLDVLNYYAECNQLDSEACQSDYQLITGIDDEEVTRKGYYELSEVQFQELAFHFQKQLNQNQAFRRTIEIALNQLSLKTEEGLYVLAYRRLLFDIKRKRLIPAPEVSLNWEFKSGEGKFRMSQFLGEDDQHLLQDFEKNQKIITDKIQEYVQGNVKIDDLPHVYYLEREFSVDLYSEYHGIVKMFQEERAPKPLLAFFGRFQAPSRRRKNWPIILLDKKVDIDQLLAIHKALKHPLTYVQGPPGSGKTKTIVNTILSAFFSERTVLVASQNNHPLNGIYQQLRNLTYRDRPILFPAIRLGNKDVVFEAIQEIREMLAKAKEIQVFEKSLARNKISHERRTKRLSEVLEKHELKLDLDERADAAKEMLSQIAQPSVQIFLQASQVDLKKRLQEIGSIEEENLEELIDFDEEELRKYLYYTGAKHIKRLLEPAYEEFRKILEIEDDGERVAQFNRYLSSELNLKQFLRAFPIVITTNVSSCRLGPPEVHFDLTIIDEAGQCTPAVSLLPILRGKNLMILGDPEQLKPVTVLDPKDNERLRKKYKIGDKYDYLENSIYRVYELVDIITKPILLSSHYRCHKKIISFNNQKFYKNRLKIKSKVQEEKPLVFVDIKNPVATDKNTSLSEAEEIVAYLKAHPDEKAGIITPFVKQKELIEGLLKEEGIFAEVGTIHAFQGDEKDVILFSSAITDRTLPGTYNWLKNNRELINVATSRARKRLVLYSCERRLLELAGGDDDFFDLYQYIKSNGEKKVKENENRSRALGFKPYSSQTEAEFMETLGHALSICDQNCFIRQEVPVKKIVPKEFPDPLYYTGQFDFVIFRKTTDKPLIVFELDGPEHDEDEAVKARDRKKEEFLESCGLKLVRVKNSYARRYNYIKEILAGFFQTGR